MVRARAKARKVAWLLALGLVAYALASMIAVHQLMQRVGDPHQGERAPAVSGLERHRITTRDGERLGAWLVPGDPAAPWVLLLHGNGGSRTQLEAPLRAHAERSHGVLALSLRAHGDSTGTRNQLGLDASEDVRAAITFLRARSSERPVIISGFSLGSSAALYAADMLEGHVQGYLLDSPYRTLRDAVRNRTRAKLPQGLEWLAYQGLCAAAPLFLVLPLDDYAPWRGLARIPASVPVTLVGSEADPTSTAGELREFALLRRGSRLVLTSHAGHRPLFEAEPARYMLEFERVLRAAPRIMGPFQ